RNERQLEDVKGREKDAEVDERIDHADPGKTCRFQDDRALFPGPDEAQDEAVERRRELHGRLRLARPDRPAEPACLWQVARQVLSQAIWHPVGAGLARQPATLGL